MTEKQHNPYAIPNGVDLSRTDVDEALAAAGIDHRSYLANGTLTHRYLDRLHPHRCVRVVESTFGKTPAEVVGDGGIWLMVRETARTVCHAPALTTASTEAQ